MHSTRKVKSLFLLFLLATVTSCYPMPEDGRYSTIPATNNPDVVGSHGGCEMLPQGAF